MSIQDFLSNLNSNGGLARPSRFRVFLPIPTYVCEFVGGYVLDKLDDLTAFDPLDTQQPNLGTAYDSRNNTVNKIDGLATSRNLSLQCEATELPGRTLQTVDAKIYGPVYKIPYQTQYQEIGLTFICTSEFYERKLFGRWMEAIMPSDTDNLRFPKETETRYLTDMTITQYDEVGREIYRVKLIDSFPIGISSQAVSWSDDGFHRLTIQFAYYKHRILSETTE